MKKKKFRLLVVQVSVFYIFFAYPLLSNSRPFSDSDQKTATVAEVSDILEKLITKTRVLDLFPFPSGDKRNYITPEDPGGKWVFEQIAAIKKINPLRHISNIRVLQLKKRNPLIENKRRYFPSIKVEEWNCKTKEQAKEVALFFRQCMQADEIRYIYFKNPVFWQTFKNRVYYISAGANMYKKHLDQVIEVLKKMLDLTE